MSYRKIITSWELEIYHVLTFFKQMYNFVNRHKLSNLEAFIVIHVYSFLLVLISKQRLFKNFSSGR
jgi:hypothetical protein